MPPIELLLAFALAALVMNLSPGPSNLYVMARSIGQGTSAGIVAALGLALGRKYEVPMPTAAISRDVMQCSMGQGNREDVDFSIVMDYSAKCSGLVLEPENVDVPSGLETD